MAISTRELLLHLNPRLALLLRVLTSSRISLPALKTIGYLIVKSTGDLDCIALGKNLSSLVFTPGKYDSGVGFTCWTVDENNRYNSSDAQSSASGASSATTTNGGSTPTGTNTVSETSKA